MNKNNVIQDYEGADNDDESNAVFRRDASNLRRNILDNQPTITIDGTPHIIRTKQRKSQQIKFRNKDGPNDINPNDSDKYTKRKKRNKQNEQNEQIEQNLELDNEVLTLNQNDKDMDRLSASTKEKYGTKNQNQNKNKNENKNEDKKENDEKDKNENKNEDKNENDEKDKNENKNENKNVYVSIRVYSLNDENTSNAKWKFTISGNKETYTLNGDSMSASFDIQHPQNIQQWVDDPQRESEWKHFWERMHQDKHRKLYLHFSHSQKPRDYKLSERNNTRIWNYGRSSMLF